MIVRTPISLFVLLLIAVALFYWGGNEKTAFALPVVAEWKTGDFTIEIKDWDNPLGIEGLDNSGLSQSTCTYQVESLNLVSGVWEVTRVATQRTCTQAIPITVGLKTGEGYKGTTNVQVQTTDCKYSGENSCRITAWAQDYAGNNSFATEYMMTRIYSIDFGPPQAKITGISPLPTFPALGQAWLRAEDGGASNRKYTFTIEYTDDALKQCELHVKDGDTWLTPKAVSCSGASRTTAFDIWVGPNPGADCSVESGPSQEPTCFLWIRAWDTAGQENTFLRVPSNRETFTLLGNETNYFPLQVDWTAPTAQ